MTVKSKEIKRAAAKVLLSGKKPRRKTKPNCAICRWRESQLLIDMCGAQASNSTLSVYNSKMCKKLFESVE